MLNFPCSARQKIFNEKAVKRARLELEKVEEQMTVRGGRLINRVINFNGRMFGIPMSISLAQEHTTQLERDFCSEDELSHLARYSEFKTQL